jgi:glutamyl-tRNA synthetase
MKMPSTAIDFVDGFMGRQTFSGTELGDFVVYKNNSEPAYQLSVVVDDSAQQVTEVLRGDDLLDSAARQLVLYDALGLEAPQFKHLPLVRGGDGLRLAKRHGDTSLHYFRQQGVRQQQLIGWIAYKSGLIDRYQELAPQDLLANFNLANVKPEPLTWKNGFEGLI